MNKDWKNNSTIYLSNISKSYMFIIYLILFLFISIFIFLWFGKIEIVVKSNGQITGEQVIVQAINDEPIIENNLKENKKINKDEILLKYETKSYEIENKKLENNLDEILNEINALNTLEKSLKENKNYFFKLDKYGYANKFNEYKSMINNYNLEINLISKNEENQNQNQKTIIKEIDQLIVKKKNYINELNSLRQAVDREYNYFESPYTELISEFNLIKQVLENESEKERNLQKISKLLEIDQKITQINKEIDELTINKAQNSIEELIQTDVNQIKENKIKLKEEYIEQVKTKLNELEKERVSTLEEQKKLNNLKDSYILKSPNSGIIHLNNEIDMTATQIPKGTTLATIFIPNKDKIMIETTIPANEINKIKIGGDFNFRLDQKSLSKKVYKGKITEISQTSNITESGIFYVVKGTMKNNIKNIKYGEMGQISIIVGKKTYLEYIKDILF